MPGRIFNILFVCRGNSARSIIAEAYLNSRKIPHICAYSAGAEPKDQVNPWALDVLKEAGIPTDNLRSKSWNEFMAPDAPVMDMVINLCEDPTKEHCPTWPGRPVTAQWAIPDPALVEGTEIFKRAAFAHALAFIKQRSDYFQHFDMAQLDNLARHTHKKDAMPVREPLAKGPEA